VTPIDEDDRIIRLRALYEETKASGEQAGAVDAELIHDIIVWIREVRSRLSNLEAQQNRAALVDALPTNAPLGALIRLRGDATGALYLGNGPTQPLSKLVPTAV
jgi:hypothetical protein